MARIVSSNEEQLELWLKGESTHAKKERGEECCPDFSCCGGNLAEEPVRRAFAKAVREQNHELKMAMLGIFLGSMIAKEAPETQAYVSTGPLHGDHHGEGE